MEENTTEITLYTQNCFTFDIPDLSEENAVTVSVIYWETKSEDIFAEAWLQSKKSRLMKFLGDVVELENFGSSDEEIEDKLIRYFNESELFNSSITALVAGDYDYFNVDDDKGDINGNN